MKQLCQKDLIQTNLNNEFFTYFINLPANEIIALDMIHGSYITLHLQQVYETKKPIRTPELFEKE